MRRVISPSTLRRFWSDMPSADEREALQQYPWPLPVRAAGYFTVLSSVASVLINLGNGDLAGSAISTALGLIFLVSFHLLSSPQCDTTRRQRLLLVLTQIASAAILFRYWFFGSEILAYMIAAELQFIVAFRWALVGTVVLWAGDQTLTVIDQPVVWQGHVVEYALASLVGFAFVTAFTRTAITELVQRRRAGALLDELNDAHRRLQAHASQVEELTVARERNRMAHDIHDTLGHYLTVINLQMETAQKLRQRDPQRSDDALATAKRLATECLNEVRRSVAALRPAALETAGLTQALHDLVTDLRQSSDLAIHLDIAGRGALRPEVEVTTYRVIQEALTNVRKHAQAQNVWLCLGWDERQLHAEVRDDGAGAPGATTDGTLGLDGMRERLVRLGGTLEVETAPGAGFALRATIPAPLKRSLDDLVAVEGVRS